MQSESHTYFFDDTKLLPGFEFSKPTAKHTKDLEALPVLSDSFTCRNINNNQTKKGLFALHKRFLAFYLDEALTTPDSVIDVGYARMKTLPKTQSTINYGLLLQKNGNSIEISFADQQTLDNWTTALKNVCVLTNFHDEYKASKMIGRGSFAKVYLVDSKSTNKQYAVKAFAKDSIGGTSKVNPKLTMLNEIDLLRALNHDNIIKLHEVHETERSIYLVMDLIKGKAMQDTFGKHGAHKNFTEKQIMEMFRSILDALAYIASKGIMHRDLKPDNILLDKEGKLHIVDFGLATYINDPEYIFKKCGTPGYIAPEVFRFDPSNPKTAYGDRCDVFSAGCILYYLLFGYAFLEGSGASEVLKANKELDEFQALRCIKKELNNPKSKINKEGLNLTLLLLEYDHKQRISANQALSHPYFASMGVSIPKFPSSKDISLDSLSKFNQSECLSPTTARKTDDKGPDSLKSEISDNNSPILPLPRSRFTEKDSLYLDVGRPELNGQCNTLSNGSSVNNSLLVKPDGIGSNASASSFARGSGSLEPKNKSARAANFKNTVAAPNNHQFLKAAIFNNMQKKSENGPGNETTKSATSIRRKTLVRWNTDQNIMPPSNGTSSPSEGSEEELDDVGSEDSQVGREYKDEMNNKNAGRMWQPGLKLKQSVKKE